MRAIWIWLAVSTMVLSLIGCASTPPSSFYTLSPLPMDEQIPPEGLSIGLGPVSLPVFLDRPQIVSRETDNRLRVDELHRWGGTLQDDFLRVWSENLALLLGTSRILIFPSEIRFALDFRIAAEVLAFEQGADGQAVLRVRWMVMDGRTDEVLLVRRQTYGEAIPAPGDTNAMLVALSATVGDFSKDVASALRTLPRPVGQVAQPELEQRRRG
ncbi:PqiC family protein [Thiorhodococcus minor]|uniref:Membrane integrity-associated transporter subunit PqiC n=1 Tax=Thiorhodococcus minor TaxID=57489 RepID=A0A6M0K825_9GAMM|nr:PqiC family protein [Thiorhodococcus minor]NEV64827.1 membrane integrity-associated transporter subunit PqiC [Thiorhodococcus minor]